MTDRLTDEQVRELWQLANAAETNAAIKQCWDDAYEVLGIERPATGTDWDAVRGQADEFRKMRGLPMLVPFVDEGSFMTRPVVRSLLAEVRRARGME